MSAEDGGLDQIFMHDLTTAFARTRRPRRGLLFFYLNGLDCLLRLRLSGLEGDMKFLRSIVMFELQEERPTGSGIYSSTRTQILRQILGAPC